MNHGYFITHLHVYIFNFIEVELIYSAVNFFCTEK